MAGTVNLLNPLVKGGQVFGINRPMYTNTMVLAANTAESITVPAGAQFVILNGNVDYWADFVTTAAIPAADVTDGSSPVLINAINVFSLEGATTISVISASTCLATASFYK